MKLLLLALLLLTSCGDQAQRGQPSTETALKKFDDPEGDAKEAVRIGNFSLRGVYRYVIIVPGINGDYEIMRMKYKIVAIEGSSDATIDSKYDVAAERYASMYNRYMFYRLGCDYNRPMDKCANYP
jgi:hypothetical protein